MQTFREAMEARDLEAVLALFAEDAVFRSPAVYAPYHGRQQMRPLLAAVGEVIEDARYTRAIGDGPDYALVLHGRVGDREVELCDFLHVNGDGLIDEMYVMVRPLSGLIALAQAVSATLGVGEGAQQADAGSAA